MRTYYSGEVIFQNENRQSEIFAECTECKNINTFVKLHVSLLIENALIHIESDVDAAMQSLKIALALNDGAVDYELDCDGEDNYVHVYVTL